MRAILIGLLCLAQLRAEERPQAVVNRETLDTAVTRGVDFLVADQNSNGSWGGPTRTKGLNIYAPIPGAHHAFRAGASGLALSGLIDSDDQRPTTLESIRKGGEWMAEHLPKLRRADQTTTYNVWGHAYGLRALVRLHRIAKDETEKKRWAELAQQQVDLLNRYEDVNGGWGYLDIYDNLTTRRPSGIPTSFTTATVLLAMDEARQELQVKLDPKITAHALAGLRMQQTPDFSYVYSFTHRRVPRRGINRPAGSLARSQACNAAMRAFGDDAITDDVLRTWAKRFIDREGFLSIGRKRPVPHETHFQISGYFYYYGIYYFTDAAEFLPKADQPELAKELSQIILYRQEKDGSWWDYPLYDYHQPYGTGYCLMALKWCRENFKPDPAGATPDK